MNTAEAIVIGVIAVAALAAMVAMIYIGSRRAFESRSLLDSLAEPDEWRYDVTTTTTRTDAPQPEGTPMTQEVKPMSEPRYKTLERVTSALEDAGLDEGTIATVREAYQAKNPSAFADESPLSDAEFRKKVVEFTRRHLRRFPRTQSALALSIAALAKGESNSYQR